MGLVVVVVVIVVNVPPNKILILDSSFITGIQKIFVTIPDHSHP